MQWELASHVAKPPDWFIDVGPGAPHSEAAQARHAWPTARILGLEPCEARFEACLPHFPGRLLKLAAWSEDTERLTLYASAAHNLWGMFAPPNVGKPEFVAGRSLDSLERELGPFATAVIWADIEGSELQMLRGATNLLGSGRVAALSLEVRPVAYAEGWCTEDEVDEFLKARGYVRARDYRESGRGHHYDVTYVPRRIDG